MILAEYAKYLREHNEELLQNKLTPIELLGPWLRAIINKNPKNNVDKIIHKELMYAENENGDYIIVGKSDSGRKLATALINFAQSYKNYNHAKWMEMLEKNYHQK